jgi:hypothetical protein
MKMTPPMLAAIDGMSSMLEGFTAEQGAEIIAGVILTVAMNVFSDKADRVAFIKHIGNGALNEVLHDSAVKVKRDTIPRQ